MLIVRDQIHKIAAELRTRGEVELRSMQGALHHNRTHLAHSFMVRALAFELASKMLREGTELHAEPAQAVPESQLPLWPGVDQIGPVGHKLEHMLDTRDALGFP